MSGRRDLVLVLAAVAGAAGLAGVPGCSLNPFSAEENEAVLDFIYANELPEVEQFRYFQQFTYVYVSDSYVTIPTYAGRYLVEFARTCPELRQARLTPEMMDQRHDNRTIRARFDTIRGCRIGKIYEITEAQAQELEELGDAPGEDIYLEEPEEAPADDEASSSGAAVTGDDA